ncbi:MAG: hypothetical protein HC889_00710 [Synechococcaceae cyanobacterium SM1_2_3]|nr:hypothetical protein [Synechococcaceae cyanobacterium SM1_2_3]
MSDHRGKPLKFSIAGVEVDFKAAVPMKAGDYEILATKHNINMVAGDNVLNDPTKIIDFVHYFANKLNERIRREDIQAHLDMSQCAKIIMYVSDSSAVVWDDPI